MSAQPQPGTELNSTRCRPERQTDADGRTPPLRGLDPKLAPGSADDLIRDAQPNTRTSGCAPGRVVSAQRRGDGFGRHSDAAINKLLPGTDLSAFGFEPGLAARSDVVRDAGRAAVRAWAREGYALADIPNAEVVADHATRELDANLTIVEGPKVRYGPTSVAGTNRVDHAYLRYMVDLPPGETYNPDKVEAARKRLLALDAFGVVDITEGEVAADGTIPVS